MNYEVLGGINLTWLLFATFILWEHLSPDKSLKTIKQRWIVNFSLLFITFTLSAALNFPLNNLDLYEKETTSLIDSIENLELLYLLGTLVFLDFFTYCLHRAFHHFQVLWRCHSVHHSDLNIDLSTNFRHHPFELICSWVLTTSLVLLLDIELMVLAIFAASSIIVQMWHHSNIKMNRKIDTYLSYIVVTPLVHRIHHSAFKTQTNSNYGTILTVWDRIFGTFTKPNELKEPLVYGLDYFQAPSQQSFYQVLKQPFRHYPK